MVEPFICQKAAALRNVDLAGIGAESVLLAYERAVCQELDAVFLTNVVHPMQWSGIDDRELSFDDGGTIQK